MRDRIARLSASSDEGMTLVEVMVAMLVLTVVFSALASVLTTSLQSLHGNENRVKANALANELLEQLRQLPWEEVGFSQNDVHGYRSLVDVTTGEECSDVTVDDCQATVTFETEDVDVPDDPRPLPLRDGNGGAGTETIERDGTEYEVRTDITWVDDPQAAGQTDYKRFRVTIQWSDLGRERSVTHSATRSPVPNEQDPAAFALRNVDVVPDLGFIKSPGQSDTGKLDQAIEFDDDGSMQTSSQGAVEIDVVTTAPVDDVTVTFVARDGEEESASLVEHDLNGDGEQDGTEWRLATTGSSSWQYRNGDTTFVITATRDDTSMEASLTRPVRYVYENNDIVEFAVDGDVDTVDPDGGSPHAVSDVCVNDDGTVAQDAAVRLTTRGMTVDDRVDIAGPGFAGDASIVSDQSTLDGAIFETVIESGHDFSGVTDDRATVEFTAVRELDDRAQTRSLALDLLREDDWEGTKCDT